MSKLRPPPYSLLNKYRGEDFHPLYTTSLTVRGGEAAHGRASGIAISDDDINIHLPHIAKVVAEELVRNTERLCPYFKMTQDGIQSVVGLTQ